MGSSLATLQDNLQNENYAASYRSSAKASRRRSSIGTVQYMERTRSTLATTDRGIVNPLDLLARHAAAADGEGTGFRKKTEGAAFLRSQIRYEKQRRETFSHCSGQGFFLDCGESAQATFIFDW